jgi:hypothetical protein
MVDEPDSFQVARRQRIFLPASKTRDRNVPLDA